MKYERQDHLIKILLKYFKGIAPLAIYDMVETLWPGKSNNVVAGFGMSFVTNEPATLGTPSTVDKTTKNEVTETSHTHKLGHVYDWKLHSPDQVVGVLDEPTNIVPSIDGTGSVDETISAGTYAIVALNSDGETLPVDVPEMVILEDTTAVVVPFDAVEGATAYRVYEVSTGLYHDLISNVWIYLAQTPATAGTLPTENTALVYQSEFTIDDADIVKIIGDGIDIETYTEPGDDTIKVVKIIKQRTDWDATEGPNVLDNKPTIPEPTINTDEKVKFDAADPTAGYLVDKIIQGTGITIAEGTGANENKLVISWNGTELWTIDEFGIHNTSDNVGVGRDSLESRDLAVGSQGLISYGQITGTQGANIAGTTEVQRLWVSTEYTSPPIAVVSGGVLFVKDNKPHWVSDLGDGSKEYDLTATGSGETGLFPATITSETENAELDGKHTHELGSISLDSVVSGSPIVLGALYNYTAIVDVRKITSSDIWEVPTPEKWETLQSYIGWEFGGDKLKETGTTHWTSPNSGATNEFGFNARGSGSRSWTDGGFQNILVTMNCWALGLYYGVNAYTIVDYIDSTFSIDSTSDLVTGNSLRFVRDATSDELLLSDGSACANYIGNDGTVCGTTKIGTQVWTSANIRERKYRNGDWIAGYDGGVYTPISDGDWLSRGELGESLMCYYDDNEAYGGGETPVNTVIEKLTERVKVLEECCDNMPTTTQPYQVLTAKDIEAGIAQTYDLIIKCRQEITIESIVVECDSGTLTGCTITIGATEITFSSGTFSVSTTLTEIAATANNVASAGARVKINTSTGYTGTPTILNVQLNYTVNG